MTKNFNGNYIKKVSFYGGLLAFFIALIVSLGSWYFGAKNELKNATDKAKSELAPFVKWYENDAQNERKNIQNLTKESYDKTQINATIKQNLADVKKIIENVDFLTKFDISYFASYNERHFIGQAQRATIEKLHINNNIFLKELELNPSQKSMILLNREREGWYDELFDFLEQKILESQKTNKYPIYRLLLYDFIVIADYASIVELYIADIYNNTCYINKQTIDKIIFSLNGVEYNLSWFEDSLEQKLRDSNNNFDESSIKAVRLEYEKGINAYKHSIKENRNDIYKITTNLKDCK